MGIDLPVAADVAQALTGQRIVAIGTDHEIRADFDREAGATCGGCDAAASQQ
jgi:hypothetical protein